MLTLVKVVLALVVVGAVVLAIRKFTGSSAATPAAPGAAPGKPSSGSTGTEKPN